MQREDVAAFDIQIEGKWMPKFLPTIAIPLHCFSWELDQGLH